MAREYLPPEMVPYAYTDGLPSVILCDLDGTAAIITDRSPYDGARCGQDTPCEEVRQILEKLALYHRPVYMSGRDETHKEASLAWLQRHEFPPGDLHMRAANDKRPDEWVKLDLFDREIRGKFNVFLVLDDRDKVVKMWRALGLKCLQVEPGDF